MEVKDLMIGDWVFVKQSQHPTKVTNIYGNSVYTDAVFQLSIDEIKPIPLTPKILEKKKNGFRVIYESELHITYFKYIQGFHVTVKVDNDGIFQKLSMYDGLDNGVTMVECKFVYQLQHAMRLYGIEKEIIL